MARRCGAPASRASRRNIAIAMANSGQAHFIDTLRTWAAEADEGLRTAATWALGKLEMLRDRQE